MLSTSSTCSAHTFKMKLHYKKYKVTFKKWSTIPPSPPLCRIITEEEKTIPIYGRHRGAPSLIDFFILALLVLVIQLVLYLFYVVYYSP